MEKKIGTGKANQVQLWAEILNRSKDVMEQRLEGGRELALWVSGEECSKQKEEPVWRPGTRSVPGTLKEHKGPVWLEPGKEGQAGRDTKSLGVQMA